MWCGDWVSTLHLPTCALKENDGELLAFEIVHHHFVGKAAVELQDLVGVVEIANHIVVLVIKPKETSLEIPKLDGVLICDVVVVRVLLCILICGVDDAEMHNVISTCKFEIDSRYKIMCQSIQGLLVKWFGKLLIYWRVECSKPPCQR